LDFATPAPQARAADASPGPALAGLCVLVVEDAADARESLQALLQLLGAKVSVVHDGREALDVMARELSPDVVLCDLLMPNLDGFEFMRELDARSAPPHPPVIAVSGLASEESRERALQAGFEGHIKKPYDEAAVVAAVGAALERRRERSAPH
jgi:CheY-like chemotaxis protein